MAMPVCSSRSGEASHVAPVVELPLSKSLAARMLVAMFWSGGCISCLGLPDADDTRELYAALLKLDAWRSGDEEATDFYLGEGGTSLRFFLPVVASVEGILADVECGEGLRRRPIRGLLEALETLGALVKSNSPDGYAPPYMVRGTRLTGGEIVIDGSVSSQFISALMLSAPMWENGADIRFLEEGKIVSSPYIYMTAQVMREFGASVEMSDTGVSVKPGRYTPLSGVELEGDWSAASYWYEFMLTTAADKTEDFRIHLSRLKREGESLQGDSRLESLAAKLGVMTEWLPDGMAVLRLDRKVLEEVRQEGVNWNMEDTPDLVPAFAVGCCVAGIPFRFTGVGHLRHKESDRCTALLVELGKIGFNVECDGDTLLWMGPRNQCLNQRPINICVYGDHRMAMAFGVVCRLFSRMKIENPEVVTKSYPGFWNTLEMFT